MQDFRNIIVARAINLFYYAIGFIDELGKWTACPAVCGPWEPCYVILPRRTVTNEIIWCERACRRRLNFLRTPVRTDDYSEFEFVYVQNIDIGIKTGIPRNKYQYAGLFDILSK